MVSRPTLAIGTPSHDGEGTGVASYAAALARAAGSAGFDPLTIAPGAARSRWARRLGALRPGVRAVERRDRAIVTHDAFREAQVHFDLYRRPLVLRCPGPPGIAHWAYPVPLLIEGWRNLYTVHDAIPLAAPDLTTIDPRRHRRLLDRLAERAAGFVTVSEAARGEIVAALGCAPGFVTNLGASVDVGAIDRAAPLPGRLAPGAYLVHVGSIAPRKNIARLVEAHRLAGLALPLVLAGPDGGAAYPATPGVVRAGYLSRGPLLRLIAEARFLAMPSLAEGFGLPVAEAMALGVPVLTSDRGALAEVAGEAALTVDPTDTAAIARAMTRLAHDDELCEGLATRGRERARAFALGPFSDALAAFYEKMGG